ncbi:MAG: GNAT family N-acetyltransferase [Streptosporangiaceae bacterium]
MTGTTEADLARQVRAGWEQLTAPYGQPRARFSVPLRVTASAGSGICPPGWIGIVTIGGAVLATAPDQASALAVQGAMASVPLARVTDPDVLRTRLPVVDLLGPASLAYLAPGPDSPGLGADEPGADEPGADEPQLAELSPQDPSLRDFLAAADPAERDESGLAGITSPAFAVTRSGRVLSAAGYRRWPNGFAHLCVLTAADARGGGLARLGGAAAVGHALAAGLLPQWRARLEPSRAVARSLGFADLGHQVSLRIGDDQNLRSAR